MKAVFLCCCFLAGCAVSGGVGGVAMVLGSAVRVLAVATCSAGEAMHAVSLALLPGCG